MIHRQVTRLLAGIPLLLAGVATTAYFGTTTARASDDPHKAPPETSSKPHGHHSLSCSPDEVSKDKGHCTLKFKDEKDTGIPVAGQPVCFTVSPANAGAVTGDSPNGCSKTDSKGVARAIFTASGSFCGHVSITGKEADGSARTVVTVTCEENGDDCGPNGPDHNCKPGGDAKSTSSTSNNSTAAAVQLGSLPTQGGMLGVLGLFGGVSLGSVGARLLRPRRRRS